MAKKNVEVVAEPKTAAELLDEKIASMRNAQKCTIEAAKVVLNAAVEAGAPEGIIDWVENPTLELSNQLMKSVDVILATGGPGMVKAAYSSGKPAIGVGPGNTPVIMDSTCDIQMAVYSVIHSKTFDNGMICASEQSVTAIVDIYDQVRAEFARRGCHILNQEELDKVRKIILNENGTVNAKIVGQKAFTIAQLAGITVPEDTKILIGEVESVEPSEPFAHEKLSPVLALYKAPDFDTATSASGIDALTHSLEAYVSIMATDYTDGLAFANAFLGVCHSMTHKLGAYHYGE